MATRFQRCTSARLTSAPYSKLCFTCKATARGIGEPAPCRSITSPYRLVTKSLDSVIPAPHVPGHSCIAFAKYMGAFKYPEEPHKSREELDDELDQYWEAAGMMRTRKFVIKQEDGMMVDDQQVVETFDIADAMHNIKLTCGHHHIHDHQDHDHNHNHDHSHHHHHLHNDKKEADEPNFFKKFVKHIKSSRMYSNPDKETLDQDLDDYLASRGKASTTQSLDDDLEAYKRSDPRNLNNHKGQQQIPMAATVNSSQEEDDEFDI